jgi:hypothetical protein
VPGVGLGTGGDEMMVTKMVAKDGVAFFKY